MMKPRLAYWLLSVLLPACGSLPDAGFLSPPEILAVQVSGIGEESATLTASILDGDRAPRAGFILQTEAGAPVSEVPVPPAMADGAARNRIYTATVDGLTPGTAYAASAFIENGAGLRYCSDAVPFSTLTPPLPPDGPDYPDDRYVTLPDENFRAWILWRFDADRDGRLSLREASSIENVELNTDDVRTLEGIAAFPSLTRLHAGGSLKEDGPRGLLETLDLSGNPKLSSLYVPHNRIRSVDLSACPDIYQLELPYNRLEAIDVSNQKKNSWMSLGHNNLRTLDVRGLDTMDELHCDHNPLETLLLDNAVLRYLDASGTRLTTLDLRRCPAINDLDCSDCPGLDEIVLRKGQVPGSIRKDGHTRIRYDE